MTATLQILRPGGPPGAPVGERAAVDGLPVMNAETRLDPVAIAALAALNISGHPDLVATVATAFLKTLPEYLVVLRQNVLAPDLKTLSRICHDLKSSSASVGAVVLAALCIELEALVRSGATHAMATKLRRIVEEIEAVCPELEALLVSRRDCGHAISTAAAAYQYEDVK